MNEQNTERTAGNRLERERRRMEATGRDALHHLKQYTGVLIDPREALGKRLGYAAGGALGLVAVMAHFIMVLLVLLIPFTPGFTSLKAAKVDHPSIVLSADGEELVRYHKLNRKWVGLDEISPIVVEALVATEDRRFYGHNGVDVTRLVSGVLHTLMGDTEGGSTLPMQMARNLYPEEIGQDFGPVRKLKEIVTAVKIEAVYSKDEILETYLNTVPFLYNTHGIEMAAETYFGKTAAELDTLEAATLVGMLKGTAYYNPARNPERAQVRRNVILALMARHDVLPKERLSVFQASPVELQFDPQSVLRSRAPHFTAHIKDQVTAWAEENDYDLYTDGLRIHTTLDLGLQEMAQAAVARQLDALQDVADVEWGRSPFRLVSTQSTAYGSARENVKPFAHFWRQNPEILEEAVRGSERFRLARKSGASAEDVLTELAADEAFMDSVKEAESRVEAGFLAMDPNTGHVKAWVGSRNFYTDQYDHVARAKRQPGSTFKPFVYATALENGYSPNDIFVDEAVEIPIEGTDEIWRPTNSGGVSGQPMTLSSALAQSKNTITAQLMGRLGAEKVAEVAHKMGVESELDEVPSLGLGVSDVSLLEMVSAYGTIAGQGTRRTPVTVTRIEDKDGAVLAEFSTETSEALTRKTSLQLLNMMRGVVNEGTAQGLRWRFGIQGDVAGKTGTTQNNADGWFILMHPDLVAGSWVGFNDRRIAFRSNYWGQGAHNALFVVGDFFQQALQEGDVDADAYFPAAPASGPGQYYDGFMGRAERWLAQLGDRIHATIKGVDLGDRERPQPPETIRGPQDRREREEERRADRERDEKKIAERRARKMYEQSLKRRQNDGREERREDDREEERQERREDSRNDDGRRSFSGDERAGW